MNGFRIVSSQEADRKMYDACIAADPSSTPFVESWYMDVTAGSWLIITNENYDTVFPFSVRSKFGIQYIYQPFFNRCTGVFGKDKAGIISAIQNGILNNYKLWDFYIDEPVQKSDTVHRNRKYQMMDLGNDYTYIYEHYSTKLRRSLRLTEKDGITIINSADSHDFDAEFRKHTGERILEFTDNDYITLKNITEATLNRKGGLLVEAIHEGRITAAALFYEGSNRILYIEGYSTAEGRTMRSMHLLFDHVIKRYSASTKKLDFGGSNLETVARFFHSFGAKDVAYYHIYRNRLPALINWLKKIRK